MIAAGRAHGPIHSSAACMIRPADPGRPVSINTHDPFGAPGRPYRYRLTIPVLRYARSSTTLWGRVAVLASERVCSFSRTVMISPPRRVSSPVLLAPVGVPARYSWDRDDVFARWPHRRERHRGAESDLPAWRQRRDAFRVLPSRTRLPSRTLAMDRRMGS